MNDSGPRRVDNVDVRRRRRSPVLVLLVAALAAFVVALSGLLGGQQNIVTPSPSPTATATPTATAIPTASPVSVATTTASLPRVCQEMSFQTGDVPIVPPLRSGQHLQLALDAVRPGPDGGNRWFVRFFVPAGAPGPAEIPLRATATGPAGPLQMGAYVAGPANAGFGPVTQPVTLHPCGSAPQGTSSQLVIGAESGPVRSGTYTFTWNDIRLPEGGMRTETWTVTLTCELDPGPARPQATLCK